MSDASVDSRQSFSASKSTQNKYASNALSWAAKLWFAVAAIGQWMFVLYVITFYGGAILMGDLSQWNQVLPAGYVPGDTVGNIAIGLHVLIAVIVIGGGPLQLLPIVRQKAPKFHRILGRIYIPAAVITSIAGLYMVWIKGGGAGDFPQHVGISVDALLIIVFSFFTIKYAMARKIAIHRKWALRLFMAVNAVWFFRVGLMFWLTVNGGPVGMDMKTFTGPFLSFLSFAQYLIPLAILELYFKVSESKHSIAKYGTAFIILTSSMCLALGIFTATMAMWLPRM